MTGVTIQRGIMTLRQNSNLNYDPGHSSALNCDPNPGSQLNVESCLVVTIQREIKTCGHNSTLNKDEGSRFNGGFQILSVGRVIIQWPPVSGEGRNSTWKIRSILSTARWIKTPWVEIQWGQNSILHRRSETLLYKHEGWLIINMFFSGKEKKEEIWLIPMSKAPSCTEKYKTQRDNTKMQPKAQSIT